MVTKISKDVPADELYEHYKRLGSFRAVGKLYVSDDRPNGISHMAVKAALVKANYEVDKKREPGTGTGPTDKIYISPIQLNALMHLAQARGPSCSRHVIAREILDAALKLRLEDYPDAYSKASSEYADTSKLKKMRES